MKEILLSQYGKISALDAVWDMNKHCISSEAKRKAQTQLVSLLFCLKKLMKLKAVIGMSIFSPLAFQSLSAC